MLNSTSNTYQMKKKILIFFNKISRKLSKPERKFTADMSYGILASGSCLLTDIVDQLHEPPKKINTVDRLSRHLSNGIPKDALNSYLQQVRKWCPENPVIHIDDSDMDNRMVTNSNPLDGFVTVRNAPPLKAFIKKGIM